MMKLTKIERMQRKFMREDLRSQGGDVFSFEDAGLTVAVCPAAQGEDAEFARVAVAQCDFKDDEYNRKRGEYLVLNRWACNETFAVPYGWRDNEEVAEAVMELMVG